MRKNHLIGVFGTLLLFIGTNVSADQLCKSVDINVKNAYDGRLIKVTRINYRDKEDKKWRDNDVKNTEIQNGATETIEESLEYVGNEPITKMQVQFQYWGDDGRWSGKVWSNVTKGLGGSDCVKNKDYYLTVSSIESKM